MKTLEKTLVRIQEKNTDKNYVKDSIPEEATSASYHGLLDLDYKADLRKAIFSVAELVIDYI